MGLEWHTRPRSWDGRFARRQRGFAESGKPIDQLHIRVPKALGDKVRIYARKNRQEINEFVIQALINECKAIERIR